MTYYVDNSEVSLEHFFETGGYCGTGSRRTEVVTEHLCDWCLGKKVQAPNFWHKSSGSWVTWYKYIGRDMRIDLKANWEEILKECLDSLKEQWHAPVAPAHI